MIAEYDFTIKNTSIVVIICFIKLHYNVQFVYFMLLIKQTDNKKT